MAGVVLPLQSDRAITRPLRCHYAAITIFSCTAIAVIVLQLYCNCTAIVLQLYCHCTYLTVYFKRFGGRCLFLTFEGANFVLVTFLGRARVP